MISETLYTILLYILILGIFGFFLGTYLAKSHTIREGARTLPRPVINPYISEEEYNIKPLPAYQGETINQMIDRYISMYFDKRGFPYTDTIELYSNYITGGTSPITGTITSENKGKLNDIGYYLLNIVIPNIQITNNPTPTQAWPAIKWTGDPIFPIQIQPTPTYKIYKGQPFAAFTSALNNVEDDSSGNANGDSGDNNGDSTDGNSNGGKGDRGGGRSGRTTVASCDNNDDCRLACPGSCLDGVAAAWEEAQKSKAKTSTTSNAGNRVDNSTSGWEFSGWNISNSSNIPGVASLAESSNTMIIGSTEVDGYQITDIKITVANPSALNTKIEDLIKYYFIDSGPNQGKPTQAAIDAFNMYFQDKAPMDGIHMNKMRDVIYYIMQSIIPGLPTNEVPRAYVEWRPIRWLSRSEKRA
jgi:hypothetical protein